MSSEHIIFSNLPGFIKEKYAYGIGSVIESGQLILFSGQNLLDFAGKNKKIYNCLYDLMWNENVRLSDFREYQQKNIQWLIDHDIVKENSEGYLKLNIYKAAILKDLYQHDVICLQYYDDELKAVVDEWCRSRDLRLADSLFSEPEQDCLNYELNKSSYSNGHDLRNKYIHSTYSEDEKTQVMEYIMLLMVMVLVVTKINEEFCLRVL